MFTFSKFYIGKKPYLSEGRVLPYRFFFQFHVNFNNLQPLWAFLKEWLTNNKRFQMFHLSNHYIGFFSFFTYYKWRRKYIYFETNFKNNSQCHIILFPCKLFLFCKIFSCLFCSSLKAEVLALRSIRRSRRNSFS